MEYYNAHPGSGLYRAFCTVQYGTAKNTLPQRLTNLTLKGFQLEKILKGFAPESSLLFPRKYPAGK